MTIMPIEHHADIREDNTYGSVTMCAGGRGVVLPGNTSQASMAEPDAIALRCTECGFVGSPAS
jgi:hypothetical protein